MLGSANIDVYRDMMTPLGATSPQRAFDTSGQDAEAFHCRPSEVRAIQATAGPSSSQTIIVVEDHDDTRELIANLLTEEGYRVVEARNGKEALDALLSGPPDGPSLVLLDLEMPVMSGWEFLSVVSNFHSLAKIPVVVTSASRSRTRAMEHASVVAFFAKPVDFDTLVGTIDSTIGESVYRSAMGAR